MDEKSSVEETKKWRLLALLCGILPVVGWLAMIVMLFRNRKKTDGVSWAIFAVSATITIMVSSTVLDADSPSESSQRQEVATIAAPTASPANVALPTAKPTKIVRPTATSVATQMSAKQLRFELELQIYREIADAYNATPNEITGRAACLGAAEFTPAVRDLVQSTDPRDQKAVADPDFVELQGYMLTIIEYCFTEGWLSISEFAEITE